MYPYDYREFSPWTRTNRNMILILSRSPEIYFILHIFHQRVSIAKRKSSANRSSTDDSESHTFTKRSAFEPNHFSNLLCQSLSKKNKLKIKYIICVPKFFLFWGVDSRMCLFGCIISLSNSHISPIITENFLPGQEQIET